MKVYPTLVSKILLVFFLVMTGCSVTSTKGNPTQTPLIIEVPVTIEITREVTVEKEVFSTIEVIRNVIITATPEPSVTPKPTQTKEAEEIYAESTSLSGNYAFTGGHEGQGCWLKVENTLSRIPPASVSEIPYKFISRIYFDLECNRGEPSFNMGFASGVIIEDGFAAVYHRKSIIPDEECDLIFIFSEDKVDVYQVGSSFACGFGANISAHGTYYRVRE